MHKFIDFFPKKFTLSLIAALVVVELLVFITGRLATGLQQQIHLDQQEQQQALALVKQQIRAETTYVDFLHFLALRTLYVDRQSVLDDIDWISQTLPRSLRLQSLSFNTVTKQVTLAGRTPNLPTFFRFARYFDERKDLTGLKRTQELNERDGSVTIGIEAKRTR